MNATHLHLTRSLRIALFGAAALLTTQAFASPHCANKGKLLPGHINQRVQTIAIQRNNTVALSGLTGEAAATTEDNVPVLGDVPKLGKLFKNKNARKEKRNLLIFVTPRVVHEAE